MLKLSGIAPPGPRDDVVKQAEAEHRAWLRTLEKRIAENGIQAEIQRYRDGGCSANELFHCLIIAREFPADFVSLACELVIARDSSSIAREFLKRSGDQQAVPALRQLLLSDQINHVYWALDALSGIRCQASIDAVGNFQTSFDPANPSKPAGYNFLEHQRQRALDVLEGHEKPYQERMKAGIRDTIRDQGVDSIVRQAAEGTLPVDEVFIALRELAEYSQAGLSLALEIGTDPKLDSHERRDPIYFLCEYRGEGAEDILFKTLQAQLDIHFSGGDAWAEGCCLLGAIAAAGSEAAIARLEALDLAREGARNASTVDLEEDRQAAMATLANRFGAEGPC